MEKQKKALEKLQYLFLRLRSGASGIISSNEVER